MEPWQVALSVAGLVIATGGFALSMAVNARKHRALEIQRAEERGRDEQRMKELEGDMNAAHDKIRIVEQGIGVLEQSQVEQGAQLANVAESIKRIEGMTTELLKMHMKGAHL